MDTNSRYTDDNTIVKLPTRVGVGKHLDVVELLSSYDRDYLITNSGGRIHVSSLKRKYVILFCLPLPLYSNGESEYRALAATFKEWNARDDIKLVIVVDKRRDDDDVLFENFLLQFPFSCLAIPFWDSCSRAFVCEYLQLGDLIVGPNNKVLVMRNCNFYFNKYGSDSFPFTREKIKALRKEVKRINRRRPVALEELLELQSDNLLISNGGDNRVSVSILKTKLVGLFLCYVGDGYFQDTLIELYKRCIELGRELEIVVVYYDDIDDFVEKTNIALQEKGISSWWVLPYKETVSRRLWRLSKFRPFDKLIIVGPNGEYLDPKADCIVSCEDLSIEASYPYAFEPLVEQETCRLKALTLDSVLDKCILTRHDGVSEPIHVPVSTLKGKNVLLCLAFPYDDSFFKYGPFDLALKWYHKKRLNSTQLELVFLPFGKPMPILAYQSRKRKRQRQTVSWLTCTPDHDHQALMIRRLSVGDHTFIAFGKDGRILTTHVFELFGDWDDGISRASIPFSDTLRQDVADDYFRLLY